MIRTRGITVMEMEDFFLILHKVASDYENCSHPQNVRKLIYSMTRPVFRSRFKISFQWHIPIFDSPRDFIGIKRN